MKEDVWSPFMDPLWMEFQLTYFLPLVAANVRFN